MTRERSEPPERDSCSAFAEMYRSRASVTEGDERDEYVSFLFGGSGALGWTRCAV